MIKSFSKLAAAAGAALALAACQYLIPSRPDIRAYTPLFEAADRCDTASVEQAVNAEPRLIRAKAALKATLLHDAASHSCQELVSYLLAKGADPNARKTDGVTPLHLAAERGQVQIAEVLVQHGAKVNATDRNGRTPLDMALLRMHDDVAAYLAQRGGRRGRP